MTAGRSDVVVAVVGAVLIAAWDLAALDVPAMRLFGAASGFPLQDAFVPSVLIHQGGRWISYGLFGWVLVNALRPLPPASALPRWERWHWLGVTVLCLALVPTLKQFSLTSCPWDLLEFGGRAQYVTHWQLGVADGGPGRCFPAGHPSGAFGFIAGYFALRPHRPRAARLWLAGTVALGVLFGAGQTLRGAHYPSHTLYTAWLCWVVCILAYRRRTRLGQPGA